MSTLKANIQIEGQDVFSTSSTATTDIGAFATTGDGRGFRYALAGATTLVPGKLQQASAEDTTNLQNLTTAVASVGATSMTTTSTVTLAANALAGGFLTVVSASTGAGYTYKVKGNTAATAAAVTIYLEDPVLVATTGTVKIDLIPNPYAAVIVNPATASSAPVGVAVYAVTNAQYGWVQTHGPVSVLADGAVTVGTALAASNAVAGAVEPLAGVQAAVGVALTGIATTDYGFVFLQVD